MKLVPQHANPARPLKTHNNPQKAEDSNRRFRHRRSPTRPAGVLASLRHGSHAPKCPPTVTRTPPIPDITSPQQLHNHTPKRVLPVRASPPLPKHRTSNTLKWALGAYLARSSSMSMMRSQPAIRSRALFLSARPPGTSSTRSHSFFLEDSADTTFRGGTARPHTRTARRWGACNAGRASRRRAHTQRKANVWFMCRRYPGLRLGDGTPRRSGFAGWYRRFQVWLCFVKGWGGGLDPPPKRAQLTPPPPPSNSYRAEPWALEVTRTQNSAMKMGFLESARVKGVQKKHHLPCILGGKRTILNA